MNERVVECEGNKSWKACGIRGRKLYMVHLVENRLKTRWAEVITVTKYEDRPQVPLVSCDIFHTEYKSRKVRGNGRERGKMLGVDKKGFPTEFSEAKHHRAVIAHALCSWILILPEGSDQDSDDIRMLPTLNVLHSFPFNERHFLSYLGRR